MGQEGFDDPDVFRLMTQGVKVIGSEPHPKCYDRKLAPATLVEEDLRETAKARRQALVSEIAASEMPRPLMPSLIDVSNDEVSRDFPEDLCSEEESFRFLAIPNGGF